MKKLLMLIVCLLLVLNLQAQKKVTRSTVASGVAVSTLIDYIRVNDDVRKDGKFQGVFALHLDVDSTAGAAPGTLYFWPLYYFSTAVGTVPVWGDTIQWYIAANDSITNTWADSTVAVAPNTQNAKHLFWATDPRFPYSGLQKHPVKKYGVYIISAGATNFTYTLEWDLY